MQHRFAPCFCALLVLSALLSPVVQAQRILYVDAGVTGAADGTSWTDAYPDLQDALAAATSGDEIWVAGGLYLPTPGTDRTATFRLQSGVALYGGFAGTESRRHERDLQANPTILSGDIGTSGDSTDNSFHVVTGSGADATALLDGFIVMGGHADGAGPDGNGGGMLNDGGSPTLMNVRFLGNMARRGGALSNHEGHPMIANAVFSGNTAAESGGALYNEASDPVLTNVTLSGNTAPDGAGIYNLDSSPAITNSIVWGNTPGDDPEENAAPEVQIDSPADGASFAVGESIDFEGSATDPEDGNLAGSSLAWTSDRDGQIGTGTSFSRNDLSEGDHRITLTATDSDGATGTAAIQLTVQAPESGSDITVALTTAPDPVSRMEMLTHTIEVRNNGPETHAFSFTVRLDLDAHAVLLDHSECTRGSTTTYQCTVHGGMEPGATETFVIDLIPIEAGTIESTAWAFNTTDDPVLKNNTAVATTSVAAILEGLERPIVFTRRIGLGARHIVRMETDETFTPLTDEADNHDPAVSPDGSKIAFVSDREPNGDGIYVMDADGSNVTFLADVTSARAFDPAWSPDGSRIAFEENDHIYIVAADGTSPPTRLTEQAQNESDPTWSADGTRIAYVNTSRVILVKEVGSDEPPEPIAAGIAPAWSPTGDRIAFEEIDPDVGFAVYVMDADGSNVTQLGRGGNPSWSSDGKKIIFTAEDDDSRDIYVMNADGTGRTNLTRTPDPYSEYHPSWVP